MKSIKPRKTRARFLEFCRYLRSLYLRQVIHDHMAKIAAQHAATTYPGILEEDTA
jgi:hypothetical protein